MNDYEILGVKALDDDETIRKAYIKLAKRYHPDNSKNSQNIEILKRINIAYSNIKRTRIGLKSDISEEKNIYAQNYPKFKARKNVYKETAYYYNTPKSNGKSSRGIKPAALILILLLIFFLLRLLLLIF